MTTILDDARKYAELGFNVVPLAYKQKIPALTALEPYFSRRSTDAELVEWFGNGIQRNLGIVCGAISELIAIDIDGESSKAIFIKRLERVPTLHDKIARTLGVASGHGKHFYLRITRSEFPNGVDATVLFNGEGGEIRVKGNRGYVVAPPSVHPSGQSYSSNGKELQTINAAEWKMLLAVFNTSEAEKTPISDLFTDGYKKSAGNNRHEDLLRVCDSLIKRNAAILSQDQIWQMAYTWNQEHCQPPLDQTEFEKQWRAAVRFIQEKNSEDGHSAGVDPTEKGEDTQEAKVDGNGKASTQSSKAQDALELAKKESKELFLDQHGTPYAAIKVKSHIETLPLNSTRFRNWLSRVFYKSKKVVLNGEDISNALNILKAEAEFGEKRHQLYLRVAEGGPDVIYYDLTNPSWQVVKITPAGWNIENAPDTLFMRYNNQQAQLPPEIELDGAAFDQFFSLTNVKTEDKKLLLKCYIVVLFWPDIPKPVLMLHGEQGSAKSTLQELIKSLVDPSSVKSLSFPRDVNELVQKLSHHYVAYFDNVSKIKEWISDELCKAVTGSGFSKRQLYTDDDDIIYNFMRVVGFNGINLGANKADLLDRGLIIELERIPKENRQKIKKIWANFEEIKPQLLGYIFGTLVKAMQLRKQSMIELKELPRMADFAEIAEIVSRSMGNKEGVFLDAYYRNIGLQTEEAIEANPIAQCIIKFMADKEEWKGSATALLALLDATAKELQIDIKGVEDWPKAPNALGRRLNEVMTNLREIGIVIERLKDTASNTRLVQICKLSPVSPEPPKPPKQARIDTGDTTGDTDPEKTKLPAIPPELNQARSGDTGDTGDNVHTSQGGDSEDTIRTKGVEPREDGK